MTLNQTVQPAAKVASKGGEQNLTLQILRAASEGKYAILAQSCYGELQLMTRSAIGST